MNRTNRILVAVAVAVIVLAGGITAWLKLRSPEEPPAPAAAVQAPIPPAAPAEPGIQNPLPPAAEPGEPLPPMAESDAPLRSKLAELFGEPAIASWLVPDSVIRNVVATVDNLPRRKSPDKVRPIKTVPGQFTAARQGAADQEKIFIDEANYARYEPLVKLVSGTNTAQLAALYQRWYPLLQEQYESLGYPGKYFNDRLVQVIDDLLQAPELRGQIELAQPNVMYEYADPQLEARSAGQKAMMRLGPTNEVVVKSKLREFRAIISTRRVGQ